jgi:hypothetical protein
MERLISLLVAWNECEIYAHEDGDRRAFDERDEIEYEIYKILKNICKPGENKVVVNGIEFEVY